MAFVGRLHPLLIHFPIALVIAAGLAECAAIVSGNENWRTVAVGNVRAGAVFALLAAIAGRRRSALQRWIYRSALATAALLVAITGHIGGLLVWGVNFLVP